MALVAPVLVLMVAGCSRSGELRNPFVKEKPFVATPVPADFAVVVDESHDSFVTRQHVQQVITAADAMSRTTYTKFSDYNNSVSDRFTETTAITPSQMQAMWNSVQKYDLLNGSTLWINWLTDADLYKRNAYTIQIRANGRTRTYKQTNGFSGPVRPLMFQLQSIRLPISQNADTPVVTPAAAETAPAAMPEPAATAPAASEPAATVPTTQP